MRAVVVSQSFFPSPLKGFAIRESMTYCLNRILNRRLSVAGVGGYSYLYEPLWWVGMITSELYLISAGGEHNARRINFASSDYGPCAENIFTALHVLGLSW